MEQQIISELEVFLGTVTTATWTTVSALVRLLLFPLHRVAWTFMLEALLELFSSHQSLTATGARRVCMMCVVLSFPQK